MWSEPTQPLAPLPPLAAASEEVSPPPSTRTPRRWPSILLFCLLAGLIPETIATTSTSVAKIAANPFSLLFVALFYGTADLVIREAIIQRPLSLAGKLLLGAAFGFVNEGVLAGTWYTVKPDGYVFINGIDWSWAVSLTVFHIFISVLLPIYLFDSVIPSLAGVPLLRRRGALLTAILFVAFSSLVFLTPLYRPQRVLAMAAAVALSLLAMALPPARRAIAPATLAKPAPGLWRLRALGFLAMLLYFLGIYLLPFLLAGGKHSGGQSALPSLLANAVLIALTAWAVALCVGWSRRPGWSPRHQLALISGALGFPILLSALPQFIAVDEFIATVPFAIFLVILAWRARRADRHNAPAPAAPIALPI